MSKYTIAFTYQPFSDSQSITEYFRPYTQDALLKIINNQTLRLHLKISKTKNIDFDTFVEKYNLQEHKYIRSTKDIPLGPDSPNWINDEDDVFESSLWDFLADAIAIAPMEKFRFDNVSYLNKLATATYRSKVDFYNLKIILSLLIYIDGGDNSTEEPFPFDNNCPNHLSKDANQLLLEFCQNVYTFITNANIDLENIISSRNQLAWLQLPQKLKDSISYIFSVIIAPDYIHFNKADQKKHKKFILNLLEKLLQEFLPTYFERSNTLALLHTLKPGTRIRKRGHDILTNLKCIDNSVYTSTKSDLINKIFSDNISYFAINVKKIGQLSTQPSEISKLDDFISNCAPKFGKENYHKKNGCFAILNTSSGQHYFAFSSIKELTNKEKMENLVNIVMENVFHLKNVYDVSAHIYPYNWCRLCDTADIRRYTELLKHGSKDPTKYISPPETYVTDTSTTTTYPTPIISNTYGCCERKLLAYSGYSQAIEIYSRWAPCWRCRPALIDAPSCRIYAFANIDEYKNNKHIDMSLKEYTIITTYNVNAI